MALRVRDLFVGRSRRQLLVCIAAWLFAVAVIVQAVRRGEGLGSAIGVCVMALLYTLLPWFEPLMKRSEAARRKKLYGTVTVDDWGVTRVAGKLREVVAWEDLAWVAIQTTDEGPGAEDFFFLLGGADGKGVVVPNFIATELNLLATLQARLPGLDNMQVALASGSTTNATFTIWKRPEPTDSPPPTSAPPN
jgi:hypothetical protein